MTALIAWLLANPTVIAIVAGVVGAFGWGVRQKRAGRKHERNRQRAKEADAYEKHLEDIADANRARSQVKHGDRSDDGFRRD